MTNSVNHPVDIQQTQRVDGFISHAERNTGWNFIDFSHSTIANKQIVLRV